MVSERWATGSSSRDWRMVDLVKMRPELPNSWKSSAKREVRRAESFRMALLRRASPDRGGDQNGRVASLRQVALLPRGRSSAEEAFKPP